MFDGNPVYYSVVVVLLAALVNVVTIAISMGLISVAIFLARTSFDLQLLGTSWHGLATQFWRLDHESPHFVGISLLYLIFACFVARAIAAIFRYWAGRNDIPRRVLYGPFSDLLASPKVNLVVAFVLSKVEHENKRLMYAGFPREIGLGQGSRVAYVILEDAQKYAMDLKDPKLSTSLHAAIAVGVRGANAMFIGSEDIENVHFEVWHVSIQLQQKPEQSTGIMTPDRDQ